MGNVRRPWPARRPRAGQHHACRDAPAADGLAALLVASARDDVEAFAQFYDATACQVFGLMSSMIADRAHAEELTVRTYRHARRTCHQFDATTDDAMAWIMRLAHRQAMSWILAAEPGDRRIRHASARRRLRTAYAERLARRRLRQAVPHWTRAQRAAFVAFYFGRYTSTQMATLRSVTPTACHR
ncbi:hypothetical protein [Leekyejoonella antrihumi]|uniref:Sigma-70 family RNA polymerase sigma factor n=1 Tax=Leekyejoonella antrihumi TaxID=1660198 RepID=A0A563DQI4_9MICO|nr:hypothetical protein [Leekyejoonella antrihumi]TWP32211.1 hypothetical protein FGL98_24470 [Leekyejoonella antrihumi]